MSGRQHELIRDALARALFDADPTMFDGLRYSVLDCRPRPSFDAAAMLAGRMVKELEHAGVWLKRDRHNPRPNAILARMVLEDHLRFAIELTPRKFRETLDSSDRSEAGSARAAMTKEIVDALNLGKVVLVRKRPNN
jgi:hypothetical protein